MHNMTPTKFANQHELLLHGWLVGKHFLVKWNLVMYMQYIHIHLTIWTESL